MSHYISFPEGAPDGPIENLIMTLVDPASDAGAITRLIAHALSGLDGQPAALFNTDPLVDYRAQRPWLNFNNGALVGLWHDGMVLSDARDMEGKQFLHLRGIEPDFHWEALVSDMLDIVERFGVRNIYSFTAIGSSTPHTRPADMVVRSSHPDLNPEVLEADFWFQASFASYLEYKVSKLDLSVTNVAVRVPMYLAPHHYSAGAAGALQMVASISGLRLPVGDLEQDAASQAEELTAIMAENEDLRGLIAALEKDYDEQSDKTGFVTAPPADLAVPSADEIGRAAEQFLAGAVPTRIPSSAKEFDPQGLIRRIDEFRRRSTENGSRFSFSAPMNMSDQDNRNGAPSNDQAPDTSAGVPAPSREGESGAHNADESHSPSSSDTIAEGEKKTPRRRGRHAWPDEDR
ncbi:PAC2 family protein [Arcanobacterium haemolyticum]|nr:PAC2 family protein [Arcanobacterium haemolyticum]